MTVHFKYPIWDKEARDHMLAATKENPIPFSQSQLNTMRTCKLQWFLSYIRKYRKHTFRTIEMEWGKTLHKHAEIGFDQLTIDEDKGEVTMFSEKYLEEEVDQSDWNTLYWLEDWMNTKLEIHGEVPQLKQMEWFIESPPEQIAGVWIKRIGVVDMTWIMPDGSLFIWDFKSGEDITEGGNISGKVNKAFKQLYYYKGILERLYYLDGNEVKQN